MPRKSIDELKSLVGNSHRTTVNFEIEAGKVAEFANAINLHNSMQIPSEETTNEGSEPIFAPITFMRTSYFPRYRPDSLDELHEGGTYFGFNLGFYPDRTVHGEQAYSFERPVKVGDVLEGITELTGVYQRDSGNGTLTFAKFTTYFRDSTGEVVVTETTTFIETP